jgi:hypothetical protein
LKTTFSQFVSGFCQFHSANNSSFLSQILNNQTQGSSSSADGGFKSSALAAEGRAAAARVRRARRRSSAFRPSRARIYSSRLPGRRPSTPTFSPRSPSRATRTARRSRPPSARSSIATSARR